MAIIRKGIKIGKHDIRTGLSKERGQGILRKLGVLPDDKGRKKFEKDAMGDVQTIRTIVGMGEGFTMPVNFRCTFHHLDMGIDQPKYSAGGGAPVPSGPTWAGTNKGQVKQGGLDWKTHIMQNSTKNVFLDRYKQANAAAQGMYKQVEGKNKLKRDEQKMNLYCSKVSIPDKSFNMTMPRTYGAPYPWPTAIQYGTITTTFYCDGTMHIKNYFDAWQKLIYNDLTGNFNFYNEYTSEFDVHTTTTMATGGQTGRAEAEGDAQQWATDLSDGIKDVTKKFNDVTGVDSPRDDAQSTFKVPLVNFRDNYGVKIFECFPSSVGSIDLGHDSASNVATFDVTWAYKKWNPFKMGNLGNRSQVNLAIGEFRNEKDGFPFLEDMPPELSGPLTSAVNQGINTGPLSKASNLFG
jgi:hypothetical protein